MADNTPVARERYWSGQGMVEELAAIPIIDGHNDTIKNIFLTKRKFLEKSDSGHVDLVRAQKAGLKCGFFAILSIAENVKEREFGYGLSLSDSGWEVAYPKPLRQEYAEKFTNELLDCFLSAAGKTDEISIIKDFTELSHNMNRNVLSVILHFEGAEAIKENLGNLEYYYRKGLRSLGIVWSRPNEFGYGVPFKFPCSPDTGPGLTGAGKELVRRCNELGIIVDLAHINEKGFFDAAKISKAPLVVSHAAVHSLCGSSTNLTDRQLDAVKDSNGVVGVIFDVLNTRPDGKFIVDTPLSVIAAHVNYIVNRIGIDHVAFGSDFDGGVMPFEIPDVTGMPKIVNLLRKSGYSAEDIEKIAYKNWLRVIKDTWKN